MAMRQRSWRNATPRGPRRISPAWSSARSGGQADAERGEQVVGDRLGRAGEQVQQVPRRRRRACVVRARIASRTDAGSSSPAWSSISTTKNGLPPVSRCEPAPDRRAGRSIERRSMAVDAERPQRDASSASGERATSPSSERSGWAAPTSSSRSVPTTSDRVEPMRRSRKRSRSIGALVGPVQVVDDEHRRVSRGGARTRRRRSRGAGRRRASADRVASSSWAATSWSGPSGRGVDSGSQAPHSTGAVAESARRTPATSDVLPAPGSPVTTTMPPRPPSAPRPRRRAADSSSCRSSSPIAGMIPTATRHGIGSDLSGADRDQKMGSGSRCPGGVDRRR